MPVAIIAIISFVLSGLVFRVLASIGFSLATAYFVNQIIDDYLVKSINSMSSALRPDVSAFLNLIGADEAISIMIGGLSFVAMYKSLKFVFVRNR